MTWPQGPYTDAKKGIANSMCRKGLLFTHLLPKVNKLLVSKVRINRLTNSVIVLTTSALLIPASETYH
jgi:hypothetical protein